jgi:hypothetical protein
MNLHRLLRMAGREKPLELLEFSANLGNMSLTPSLPRCIFKAGPCTVVGSAQGLLSSVEFAQASDLKLYSSLSVTHE